MAYVLTTMYLLFVFVQLLVMVYAYHWLVLKKRLLLTIWVQASGPSVGTASFGSRSRGILLLGLRGVWHQPCCIVYTAYGPEVDFEHLVRPQAS